MNYFIDSYACIATLSAVSRNQLISHLSKILFYKPVKNFVNVRSFSVKTQSFQIKGNFWGHLNASTTLLPMGLMSIGNISMLF
jgi:hypothetical protein